MERFSLFGTTPDTVSETVFRSPENMLFVQGPMEWPKDNNICNIFSSLSLNNKRTTAGTAALIGCP